MKQERLEQVLIRRVKRKSSLPFRVDEFVVALRRFGRFDVLRIDTESNHEMIVSRPVSFLIDEVFGNAFSAGREIRIYEPHLQQRMRLTGGNVDDVGERLTSTCFSREFVEHPRRVGPVVLRLDIGISLLKLLEQRG